MEENNLEEKEIVTTEMKDKYIVYDHSTRETRQYTANNRQEQKFRVVKFFKGNGAVNYLGPRHTTKKYLRKKDSTRSSIEIKEDEKTFTLVNKTK